MGFVNLANMISPNYQGKLMGICRICGSSPRIQKHNRLGTFIAKCYQCSNRTADYFSMNTAIDAWNERNKITLSDELKSLKEGKQRR